MHKGYLEAVNRSSYYPTFVFARLPSEFIAYIIIIIIRNSYVLFQYPSNYARFTAYGRCSLNNYMYFDVYGVTSRIGENVRAGNTGRGFSFGEREVSASRCAAALVMFNSCFFFLPHIRYLTMVELHGRARILHVHVHTWPMECSAP